MPYTVSPGNNLTRAAAAITVYPGTVGVLFQTTSVAANKGIMGISDGTGTNDWSIDQDGGANLRARCNDGTGAVAATCATTIVINTWILATMVLASATSRSIFHDGAAKATNATSRTPTGLNKTQVGTTSAAGTDLTGIVAMAFILNIGAADADVAAQVVTAGSIYKSPLLIPAWIDHVVAYWRLDSTGALADVLDRGSLSLVGAPTVGVNGLQVIEPIGHALGRALNRGIMKGM